MNVVKKTMIAFIPVILGGIIYAIYRTENLKMFKNVKYNNQTLFIHNLKN